MEAFLEVNSSKRTIEKLRFGCLSWTYPDWLGSFYPVGTKPAEFLPLYSKVFDLVEIDSTFYRTPAPSTMRNWKEKTPPNFLFTAKLPGKITHEKRLVNVESEVQRFEESAGELREKLACLIAQLPPNSKYESDFDKLEKFLEICNPAFRLAIEFRNKSWLRGETFQLLSRKKVCFVWNVQEKMGEDIVPRLTTNFFYLRFMGKYGEFKRFNKVQKDRSAILEIWWKRLEENLGKVSLGLVLVSNHFSGFAPATVNEIKKLAGLNPMSWSNLPSSSMPITNKSNSKSD